MSNYDDDTQVTEADRLIPLKSALTKGGMETNPQHNITQCMMSMAAPVQRLLSITPQLQDHLHIT